MNPQNYWLPTVPMTLIDAINRRAAATGSVMYAVQTAHADYNGHYVRVYFNDYRGYWLAEYQWGERVVLRRGTAQECLRAAHDYYKRGDKGSTVVTSGLLTEADIAFAESLGFVPHTKEAEQAASCPDERFNLINEAFMYEKQIGIPAIGMLANSASTADFKDKVNAFVAARKRSQP